MKLLDEFNVDNVCWESRLPALRQLVARPPPSGSRCCSRTSTPRSSPSITHDNAMRHYQFDPFAHPADPERCTVGALRAEATDVDTVTRVGRLADERDLATWKQMTGAAARPRS